MSDDATPTPLYVRLSPEPNRLLQEAALASGRSKRQIVEDAVREHLTDDGLVVGRIELRENSEVKPISSGPEPPEVLTLPEAAALLRVDEAQLQVAVNAGDLPGRLIGGAWRFSKSALLAWLAASA